MIWQKIQSDELLNLLHKGKALIIDVRSPKEYLYGSIPNSINLPIFENHEHKELGILYKTEGQKDAFIKGLEFFANKAEKFTENFSLLMNSCKQDKLVVITCLRGGFRSQSVATFLRAQGHNLATLQGGYKSFRKHVAGLLDQLARHPLLVLYGRTGSGKTDLIRNLKDAYPSIDFEGLARHRGSALGNLDQNEEGKTQQNFENELAITYLKIRDAKEIIVESENYLGNICLPPAIRLNIRKSPGIHLTRSLHDRINLIKNEYTWGWDDKTDERFKNQMELFAKHLCHATREKIINYVLERNFDKAISLLLEKRYDPLYDKCIKRQRTNLIATFNLTTEREKLNCFFENRYR